MSDPIIVASFVSLLQGFSGCFTAPSMSSFVTLLAGWVLDLRRHTITEVIRAAGAVGHKHISSYHRFFSRARWTTDEVGLTLADLVIKRLASSGVIRLVVDDTLGRHTGKRIAAASMHRDPLLSTGRRPFFHWGHIWVVLAIEIELFDKSWALPVLFRLHRSEKRCKAEKRPYRKLTEQARELVEPIARRPQPVAGRVLAARGSESVSSKPRRSFAVAGLRSRPRACSSICRILSRETPKVLPMSPSVCGSPSSSPNRMLITKVSRGVRLCRALRRRLESCHAETASEGSPA